MHKKYFSVTLGFCFVLGLLWCALPAWGGSDMFIGDTAIYSGDSENLKPNILFLIDNSAGMRQGGSNTPYNPATPYPNSGYEPNGVYTRTAATGGTINYVGYYGTANGINSVTCAVAKNLLQTTGYYAGPLKKNDGSCNASQSDNYYLGNFINYTNWALSVQYPAWQPNRSYNSGERISWTKADGSFVVFEAFSTIPAYTVSDPLGGPDTVVYPPATSGAVTPNFAAANYCTILGQPCSAFTGAAKSACESAYSSSPKVGCDDRLTGLPDGPNLVWRETDNLMMMIQGVLKTVISGARQSARFGVMTFGSNNKGGQLWAPIKDIDAQDLDGAGSADTSPTDFNALIGTIGGLHTSLLNANSQPVHELFYDVGQYFRGQGGYFGNTPSPIPPNPMQYSCQNNYAFLITTGVASNSNPGYGDLNGDGLVGRSDDGAMYVYNKLEDMTPYNTATWPGAQRVNTTVVQVMTPRVPELENVARLGHGLISDFADTEAADYVPGYYHANNSAELALALVGAINTAIDESDTSFVAPVVPTSPENRTYSGERIYLGFFQPIREQPWRGNLKKYGFNDSGEVVGQDNQPATESDTGAFKETAKSFWSAAADGRTVQKGGVGEVLANRNLDTDPRNIYTNRGTTYPLDLTDSSNEFTAANVPMGEVYLGTTTAMDALISYLKGFDAYDDDADGDFTEKRAWLMGDVLHSKPLLVNYNHYDFTATSESSCSSNKTIIYVGTNDGFFHAFRDCDGKELWAFIPKYQLASLNLLTRRPARHAIYNDASATVYTYDADNDGNIGSINEAGDGDPDTGAADKVLLILAARRGGEYIVILDVTDPERPIMLNGFNRYSGAQIAQLKETWSEPKIGKVKYLPPGSSTPVDKLALFFGAGYDNRNEDTRFGNTMSYTNVPPPVPFYFTGDSGLRASAGIVPAFNLTNYPLDAGGNIVNSGRGIYAVDLATLNARGVPTLTTGLRVLWSKKFDPLDPDLKLMSFSFPSDLSLADTNYDDYIDRIYVGDAGGQLWRFSGWDAAAVPTTARATSDPIVNNWAAKRIFVAGWPGTSVYPNTAGRKIFYRPSITFEAGGVYGLYFGTGDREHPLNTQVLDRFYAVYDRGQDSFNNYRFASATNPGGVDAGAIDDNELVDVTTNTLQDSDGIGTMGSTTVLTNDTLLSRLYSTNYYGWYINLNLHPGEKILAPPLVLNRVAYFTTYTPNAVVSVDPCAPGNLGVSRAYAVNYKTGEAVLNFDTSNDGSPAPNERGLGAEGEVLLRSDREMTVGVGIPSGLVTRMTSDGEVQVYIGGGGGLKTLDPVQGGTIIPIYWLNW